MTNSSPAIHYSRHLDTNAETRIGACGTVAARTDEGRALTANKAEVTCRRCLKTIETGSADTGILAGR
jgi:hypothetical protein